MIKRFLLPLLCLFCVNTVHATSPENTILIPGRDFYPEGITSDAGKNLYVGSLKNGTIYKVKHGKSVAKEFIAPGVGGLMSVTGMIVDKENNLWVCSADPGVSKFTGKDKPALKKINLKTKVIESFQLPNGGFCNDLAIDDKNNIYITDSFNPRLLVLEKNSKTIVEFVSSPLFSGEGFNLNGIAFDGQSSLYTVKYNTGKLFRVDLHTKAITEIHLPRVLFAPDGLKYVNGNLIVIEGGATSDVSLATAGSGKITQIAISKNTGTLTVLKDGLDVPTTFTVIGNEIFVVESQYDHLFRYKDVPPTDFLIRKFKI